MGEFVPCEAPLFRVDGSLEKRADVVACVVLEPEPSHEYDPSYGIRKLVDITMRSIASSPFDDPTTSVQALHRVHDCMRLLATRELPDGHHHDPERAAPGDPGARLAGLRTARLDEIRLVGASCPQVARALRAALEDVKSVAPADRRPPLDRQLHLLSAAADQQYDDDADTRAAHVPDGLGIGSGSDVVPRNRTSNGRQAPGGAPAPR